MSKAPKDTRTVASGVQKMTPSEAFVETMVANGVTDIFGGRTIAFSASMAKRCAGLHFPHTISERDAMIAATALEHHFTVVTRNIKDFQTTGAKLLNPWES